MSFFDGFMRCKENMMQINKMMKFHTSCSFSCFSIQCTFDEWDHG